MQALIFEKVANGLPGPALVDDLAGRIIDVELTRSALWGDLAASVTWLATLDEAFWYADRYLGNRVVLVDDDGALVWAGLIWSVTFGGGTRRRRRSLDGYANRARVHYRLTDFATFPPADLGPATPIVAEDTAQQAIYGIIEHQQSEGGVTEATATAAAARSLAMRKHLLWSPESGGGLAAGPGVIVEIELVGSYRTLFYQAYTSSTTGTADIAQVVKDVLTARAPFVSGDQSRIANTGTSVGRSSDTYELAGEVIRRVMRAADGYTFGIDSDRIPYLVANKRLSTTVDYVEREDGTIEDASGAEVKLWRVRPDAVLRQVDFVPASVPLTSAAITSVEALYLAETTWRMSSGLTYKPAVAGVLGEIEP